LALFSGFLGKKIILDCYVPHWIELDEIVKKTKKYNVKLLIKSYFNVARSFFGVVFFNAVIVANNEVVALGGLVQNTFSENESRVPVLGKIPVLGWLFKNKIKDVRQSSILVLISPEILPTDNLEVGRRYTQTKIDTVEDTIASTQRRSEDIDPINRWFFNDSTEESQALIDEFAQKEGRYLREGVQDNPTGQTEDLGQKAFSEYFE
jgi:hypothetical protein